jgi:hypothetical protein
MDRNPTTSADLFVVGGTSPDPLAEGEMAHATTTTGLTDEAFDRLKQKLIDLVEPLSDSQLLDLADGIHELLRQRRTLRQHQAERMTERARLASLS